MEEFTTNNKKLFSLNFRIEQIDSKIIKKYNKLFKIMNYFDMSALVINNKYEVFDIEECAKMYAYIKWKKTEDISYVFVQEEKYVSEQEKAHFYISERDIKDKKNLPDITLCFEKYKKTNYNYQRLQLLIDEFGVSLKVAIMLFGVQQNYQTIREGRFSLKSETQIEKYRGIFSKLKWCDKFNEYNIKGGVLMLILGKLEELDYLTVANMIKSKGFEQRYPYTTGKTIKCVSGFVDEYNSLVEEKNKISNPYDGTKFENKI